MSDFWILRRLRAYLDTRKSYEPFTLMDILLDSDTAPPGSESTVEVTCSAFAPGPKARHSAPRSRHCVGSTLSSWSRTARISRAWRSSSLP